MSYRISLWYNDPQDGHRELFGQDTETDDPVYAFHLCQQLQDKALPILKAKVPAFKRAQPSDFARRIDWVGDQLKFDNMEVCGHLNGHH